MEFRTYLQRVLKQNHPDTGCTAKGMTQLNQLSNSIGLEFAKTAVSLCKDIDHITVTSREIQTAVYLIVPNCMRKKTVEKGKNAVTNYNRHLAAMEDDTTDESHDRCRRELKAGINFPVARCAKLIKSVDKSMRIGQCAPVYLAAVLEYLMSDILELSGNICRDNNRVCITPRHIHMSIDDNEDLNMLLKRLNIHLLEGGVTPNIHPELLKTKNKRKTVKKTSDSSDDGTRKPHRFRPGTVALREIRKYQKTSEPLTQFAPFERFVREVVGEYTQSVQFAIGSLQFLHEVLESKIVELFEKAQELAIHAKRTSVNVSDIKLIRKLTDNECTLTHDHKTTDQFIVNNAIVRLARRGGVKRLDHLVYDEIRSYANLFISSVLYSAVALLAHRRAVNVTIGDVQKSLASLNFGNFVHAKTV